MILEVVDIRIRPGEQAAFEQAVRHGVRSVIAQAEGFQRHELRRGIESPERFLLFIWWRTLEDHTIGFRTSPGFAQWRAIVGPFFAEPPRVEHFEPATAAAD